MFSGLSKLADKAFILGFFFPALLGVSGLLFANRDIPLLGCWLTAALATKKDISEMVALLFVLWVMAIFLMVLNLWVYRFLEGYHWPLNCAKAKGIQRDRAEKLRRKWTDAFEAYEKAANETARIKAAHGENAEFEQASGEEARLRSISKQAEDAYRTAYPDNSDHILGTRLGNVTRSFEIYPSEVYGIEAIYAWPRLTAVIPKEYMSVLSDARAAVDMFMNLVVVSTIISATAFVRAILHHWLANNSTPPVLYFVIIGAIAGVISWLCYEMSIYSSIGWGEKVKSAFDVYLGDLAKKLGYEVPSSSQREREFWGKWSDVFQFHWPKNMDAFKRVDEKGDDNKGFHLRRKR